MVLPKKGAAPQDVALLPQNNVLRSVLKGPHHKRHHMECTRRQKKILGVTAEPAPCSYDVFNAVCVVFNIHAALGHERLTLNMLQSDSAPCGQRRGGHLVDWRVDSYNAHDPPLTLPFAGLFLLFFSVTFK